MKKPILYLFVGYPGAGKTTIAKHIEDLTGAVHIWADRERQIMFGHPTHSRDESHELYDYLNSATARLLDDGESVIFDTNFNFRKDRDHLRQIAAEHGAEAVVVWVTTPKELAKRRAIEESDGDGQHTRLYGNMDEAVFERIAGHLEPPSDDEKVLKIDGTEIDRDTVAGLLST